MDFLGFFLIAETDSQSLSKLILLSVYWSDNFKRFWTQTNFDETKLFLKKKIIFWTNFTFPPRNWSDSFKLSTDLGEQHLLFFHNEMIFWSFDNEIKALVNLYIRTKGIL